MLKQYKQFMLESNRIEGEDRINPGDIEAVEYILGTKHICCECLIQLHSILGKYLNKDWVGVFRKVNVTVGEFQPINYSQIQLAMEEYAEELPYLTSWTAHNKFEKIHPFQDLNGRVGRLIWLSKAYHNEGYKFSIPFLQAYYYQTLKIYDPRK